MTPDTTLPQPGTYTQGVKAIVLNRILLILSFIGLFVAGALSIEKRLNIILPCGNGNGCAKVAADSASSLFGIPVAYIGFAAYILFAGLAIARTMGTPNHEKLVKIGLACSVLGALFSIYLQYRSFVVIKDICPYCFTSAVVMVLSAIAYWMLNGTVAKENFDQVSETGRKIERDLPKLDLALIVGVPVLIMGGLAALALAPDNHALHGAQEATLANLTNNEDKTFGPANAPLTVVEFFDMCCPPCQKTSPLVKEFALNHEGKVRIVFHNFPLKVPHPYAQTCAAMGEYADEKGKFLDFMLSVMGLGKQPESVEQLLEIAKTVGLDTDDMEKRLKNPDDVVYKKVADDVNLGHAVGVDSTPTYILFAPGVDKVVAGPQDIMDKLNGDAYKKILGAG